MITDPKLQHGPRIRLLAAARLLAVAALLVAGLSAPVPVTAQDEETAGSVLAAATGGVVGVVAGGYANLAVVVLKARFDRYPHSFRDAFGWESAPVLIGGATGATIGLLDKDLVLPWIIGGTAGFVAGTGAGYLYGHLVWDDPESRWANAAIGAAIGMALGSTVALARELSDDDDDDPSDPVPASAVRVPLLQIDF